MHGLPLRIGPAKDPALQPARASIGPHQVTGFTGLDALPPQGSAAWVSMVPSAPSAAASLMHPVNNNNIMNEASRLSSWVSAPADPADKTQADIAAGKTPSRNLYVQGFGAAASTEDLRSLFSQHWSVAVVVLCH